MPFSNPDTEAICWLLHDVHRIAVVGLSPNESRPSHRVARDLQSMGYRIIPVRPLPQSAGRNPHLNPLPEGEEAIALSPSGGKLDRGLASNVSEVRPQVDKVLGEKVYPNLESLPELPDIVEVFRAAEHVPAIVESCIKLGIKNLWLQEGIIHEAAALRAQAAGMMVVMDRCMWRDLTQLCGGKP